MSNKNEVKEEETKESNFEMHNNNIRSPKSKPRFQSNITMAKHRRQEKETRYKTKCQLVFMSNLKQPVSPKPNKMKTNRINSHKNTLEIKAWG